MLLMILVSFNLILWWGVQSFNLNFHCWLYLDGRKWKILLWYCTNKIMFVYFIPCVLLWMDFCIESSFQMNFNFMMCHSYFKWASNIVVFLRWKRNHFFTMNIWTFCFAISFAEWFYQRDTMYVILFMLIE